MTAFISFFSHQGKVRTNNEDVFAVFSSGETFFDNACDTKLDENGIFLAVADGMGGANAGEIAADLAVSTVRNKLLNEHLVEKGMEGEILRLALIEAHTEIIKQSILMPERRGMGTTMVLLWLTEKYAHIAWCGDSRCYLLRENKLSLLTDDHTLVNDYLKKGLISPETAKNHPRRNILTQVLGDESDMVKPEFLKVDLQENDAFMLCSDGLNGMLSDEEIQKICNEGGEVCAKLVEQALERGGHDNVTVIFAEIKKKRQKQPLLNT